MKLSYQVPILYAITSLLGFLLVFTLISLRMQDVLLLRSAADIESTTKIFARQVEDNISDYNRYTNLIASRTKLRSLVAESQFSASTSTYDGIAKIISDAKRSVPIVAGVHIEGVDRSTVIHTRKGVVSSDPGDRTVLTTHFVGFARDAEGTTLAEVKAPLFLDGEYLGIMTVFYYADDLFRSVLAHDLLSDTGEVILYSYGPLGVVPMSPFRFDAPMAGNVLYDDPDRSLFSFLERRALNSTFNNVIDYRGEEVIAHVAPIRGIDWLLVGKMDRREALASVWEVILFSAFAAAIALALSVFVWTAVSRTIIRPILIMRDVANKIRSGDFAASVPVLSNNEVGELAMSINALSKELGQLYTGMEKRIVDRTKEVEEKVSELEGKNTILEKTKSAMLNILEDVEEEKSRYKLQVAETKKFKQLADYSQDSIVLTDTDAEIVYVNKAWQKLNGFTESEALGMNPRVLKSGETPNELYNDMWEALTQGESFESEDVINKRKDGSVYNARLIIYPLLEDGKTKYYAGSHFDITSRKEADKAKNEFVSVASHQLRTPLSTIGWYAEMLFDGDVGKMTKKQLDLLHEIIVGNKRMVNLVNALLNVSRLDLGTFRIDSKPKSVHTVINTIIKMTAPQAEGYDIKVKKSFDKTIRKLKVDENLLMIVLENLISNAIKYTPKKGSVTIKTRKIKEGRKITHIAIDVKDTGFGIPAKDQRRIFEKLFRASNILEKEVAGTGLGLYIAKKIMITTGGDLTFVSKINKGTTFTAMIPVTGMIPQVGKRKLTLDA